MKYFKIVLIILILCFLGLYFTYQNGYYERNNYQKRVLTDEKILEYEEDLKNGINVDEKDYVIISPDYTNIYSNNLLKVSHKVENLFDKVIKYFFNKVSKSINE